MSYTNCIVFQFEKLHVCTNKEHCEHFMDFFFGLQHEYTLYEKKYKQYSPQHHTIFVDWKFYFSSYYSDDNLSRDLLICFRVENKYTHTHVKRKSDRIMCVFITVFHLCISLLVIHFHACTHRKNVFPFRLQTKKTLIKQNKC